MLLRQDKRDIGAHRFTQGGGNLLVAATDLPGANGGGGAWKNPGHYSRTHKALAVYGLEGLYVDRIVADEDLRFVVAD